MPKLIRHPTTLNKENNMIPNQSSLPVYVNNVLKLNSWTYRSGNLTNIVAVTKLLEYMPFKVNGGMMMSPDFSCVIVYTDHKDIDQQHYH